VSRLLWVGVGAAGGIYLYRRGNRAWDEAKERGVAGNAAILASSASSMLNHAKRTLVEVQEAKDAKIVQDRAIESPRAQAGQAPSQVQQRVLVPDPQRVPIQDPLQGMWHDPQTGDIYEVHAENGDRRERPDGRIGRKASRVTSSRGNPVRFMAQRNRSSA
jgi:hypothetical protein